MPPTSWNAPPSTSWPPRVGRRRPTRCARSPSRRGSRRSSAGEVEPPGAHLGRYAVPTKAEDRRFGRFLEIWAALSIGLLLLGLVFVAFVFPQLVVLAAIAVIAAFLFLDSVLRGTVAGVASTITLTLAGLVLLILAITFWAQALVIVAIAAAGFVIWQNLSELRS